MTAPVLANLTGKDIDRRDRQHGYSKCGFHYVIAREGTVSEFRRDTEACVHIDHVETAKSAIGICLIGGTDEAGKPEDNFTLPQWDSMKTLIRALGEKYQLTSVRSFTPAVTTERLNQIIWRPNDV